MFLVDPWIICAMFHFELIASFKLSSGLCLVLVFLVEIYELELLFPCPLLSLVRDLDISTFAATVRRCRKGSGDCAGSTLLIFCFKLNWPGFVGSHIL